ncbi:MAG: rod shape-determining protein MreD [Rheinheimera sp.]|nr:rod shape-determining protein MreD [Rheinheimera sp.]
MSTNWRFLWVHVTVVFRAIAGGDATASWQSIYFGQIGHYCADVLVLALPHRISIGTAFVFGFLVDVMVGTILGVNALGYSVVAFIVAANYAKIRNFSILQQSLLIGLIFAFYHLLIFWLSHFLTGVSFRMAYLWPVLTSMALWPYIFYFYAGSGEN